VLDYYIDPSIMTNRIMPLPAWKQAALAWVLASRMFPVYARFVREFRRGDVGVFAAGIELVRRTVFGDPPMSKELDRFADGLKHWEPTDDEDPCRQEVFDSMQVLGSAVFVCYGKHPGAALDASTATLGAFVDDSDEAAEVPTDRWEDQQPRLAREFEYQTRLLDALDRMAAPDLGVLETFIREGSPPSGSFWD
jgi:hypothetical protein